MNADRPTRIVGVALAALALAPLAAASQGAASRFEFTIANMMRGPEVYGREPQRPRFTPDGRWIYFNWLPPGTDWRESLKPYRARAQAGAQPEQVTRAHMDSVGPLLESGSVTSDGLRRVVAHDGDLWLVDTRTSAVRRLTDTPVITEGNPHFSTDGRRVYFIRDGTNVMALDLDAPLVRQLTDIRPGPGPSDSSRAQGQRAALEAQQKQLFGAIRDEVRQDSIARAEREAR